MLEAKETRILRDEVTFCSKDMNEQAEISFKMGVRQGIKWAKEIGLNHFIDNFQTGEHHPNCRACQLLKEWGIDRGRREVVEFLQGELTKLPNMPDPNAECNALNGLISQIIELYGISPHPA